MQTTDKNLWWERGLAILIAVNFGWVLFDLSYIPWRNLYFRYLPGLTKVYDPLKGIEPHRETTKYLATVDRFKQQNLQSATTLKELVDQSVQTVETNPFQGAGKSGALEKIKIRRRLFGFFGVRQILLVPRKRQKWLSSIDRFARCLILIISGKLVKMGSPSIIFG
jgi:hypothetical protein